MVVGIRECERVTPLLSHINAVEWLWCMRDGQVVLGVTLLSAAAWLLYVMGLCIRERPPQAAPL